MRLRDKLVYGVGVNDSDYNTTKWGKVKGKRVVEWRCPFYEKWYSMIRRCYSGREKAYTCTTVCEEWLIFSRFKAWMVEQDWQGNHLDKDLLIPGNQVYSPESCVFIDVKINNFMIDCADRRGEYPTGVSLEKRYGSYTAQISIDCETVYLGSFSTPDAAHCAWRAKKNEIAKRLASNQTDPRVSAALINRYKENCK